MRASIMIASICLSVAGCSSASNQVQPIYIAPHQYQTLSCEQIADEAQRVAHSAAFVASAPRPDIDDGGKVIMWPTLAHANTDNATKATLGRLKGQFDALVVTAQQKSCGLDFQQAGT
ncbi:MAG TPA: hypothetical protein VH852_01795 [Hyphomicrobium sp.]|jgi:hypothetical protein